MNAPPLTTVHVRINDAATGQPTPVRLRITDAAGDYWPPLGRLRNFAPGRWGQDVGGNLLWGGKVHAFVEGAFEVPLPPGPITIEATKGPEYRPLRQVVTLPAGKLALRLTIERWANLREQGWYSGDTWVGALTPRAALLEAAAEDVAVANILAHESVIRDTEGHEYPCFWSILEFSGQGPAAERPGHLVAVNTLNTHPVLGRLMLLNCHRVVYPLTFGGEYGQDDWALDEWCDQCHRKGGLVIGHFFSWSDDAEHPHGEIIANLLRGKIDALDLDYQFQDPEIGGVEAQEWYRLLNCGVRVPLVRGSGKNNNLRPLGAGRVYARLRPGEELTYKNWIEAVRAGRTFITNGPLLTFTVNDAGPGAVVDVAADRPIVRVRAEARGLEPFERLDVVANGAVVATASASGSPATAHIEAEVPLPEGGWLAARCVGPLNSAFDEEVGAHSSPVYVTVDGRPRPADPTAKAHFAAGLEKMLAWVRNEARCPTERDRERLAAVFRDAQRRLAGPAPLPPGPR